MKLITVELETRAQQVGRQENNPDPLVIAKFFNPVGAGTWYITEYYPDENICFGYVKGLAVDEWGYVSVDELESIKLPYGMRIERDLYFDEAPISRYVPAIRHRLEIQKKQKENEQEKDDLERS